jgi:hypothetical protein
MNAITKYIRALEQAYRETRAELVDKVREGLSPSNTKKEITRITTNITARLSYIIADHLELAFKRGTEQGLRKQAIKAAMPNAVLKIDPTIPDTSLGRLTRHHIGIIGNYNLSLSKTLIKEYDTLLSDNRFHASLRKDGWTPWMDKVLAKRGVDPAVISLVKQHTSTAKIISIIEKEGIHGGLHSNDVAKRLVPHINRYFGPGGVVIDNVGKKVTRRTLDCDGVWKSKEVTITRAYTATPKAYARAIARNSMHQAHQDGYRESLAKSKDLDYFISISLLDPNTCATCASMHGRRVTKGSGPQYHGNCGCSIVPVWKKDSVLWKMNKPADFYKKQQDVHFLRMQDLKNYNASMPRGSKVKFWSQLPDTALTKKVPDEAAMRSIRRDFMGGPAKAPKKIVPKKTPIKMYNEQVAEEGFKDRGWGMSDAHWEREATRLYAKTAKDGKEHLKIINGKFAEVVGNGNSVVYTAQKTPFMTIHTHPVGAEGWDSPLSGADIYSFLSEYFEYVSCATTNKHLYMMRRTADTTPLLKGSKAQRSILAKYKRETKKTLALYGTAPYTFEQQRQAMVTAGRAIAQKYHFDYKVIRLD